MVDEVCVHQWERDARDALESSDGKSKTEGHLAAVVLALIRDRESLLAFLERVRMAQARP
jgi:hypothetical protein